MRTALAWSQSEGGNGHRVPTLGRGYARIPKRAFNSLNFTKPETEWHGARRTSWSLKCPFWMSSTQWGRTATVWAERPVSGDKWAGGAAGDGAVCSGWATVFREKEKARPTSAFQEHRNRLCLLRLIVCLEAFTYGLIVRSIRPVFRDESEC